MAVTFCLPPRPGELCASLTFELPGDHTTQQLTARHRVTGVCLSLEGKVLIAIDITDPATARPVDVRFDVVPHGSAVAAQSRLAGSVDRDGQRLDVYGTYLGPVADENLLPARRHVDVRKQQVTGVDRDRHAGHLLSGRLRGVPAARQRAGLHHPGALVPEHGGHEPGSEQPAAPDLVGMAQAGCAHPDQRLARPGVI
jgi:hypothetical protein